MDKPLLSKRLPYLRKKSGMSREEFAFKAKISFSYVMSLENGTRRNPSQDILVNMADAFGISVDELIGHKVIMREK